MKIASARWRKAQFNDRQQKKENEVDAATPPDDLLLHHSERQKESTAVIASQGTLRVPKFTNTRGAGLSTYMEISKESYDLAPCVVEIYINKRST
jgi:hypothetical protein